MPLLHAQLLWVHIILMVEVVLLILLQKRGLLIRVHCLICVFTFVFTEVLYRKDVNAFARPQAFWISTKFFLEYNIKHLDFSRFNRHFELDI